MQYAGADKAYTIVLILVRLDTVRWKKVNKKAGPDDVNVHVTAYLKDSVPVLCVTRETNKELHRSETPIGLTIDNDRRIEGSVSASTTFSYKIKSQIGWVVMCSGSEDRINRKLTEKCAFGADAATSGPGSCPLTTVVLNIQGSKSAPWIYAEWKQRTTG